MRPFLAADDDRGDGKRDVTDVFWPLTMTMTVAMQALCYKPFLDADDDDGNASRMKQTFSGR